MATHREGERYVDPKVWQAMTPTVEGSWWPAWQTWLVEHSTGPVPAPRMGCPEKGYPPLADAPGGYVLQE
jgi:polyhydroxyalkanoate synthase